MKSPIRWSLTLLALATIAPAQDQPRRPTPKRPLVEITPEQEEAVERGLSWLAARQSSDGSWAAEVGYKLNSGYRSTAVGRGHVGVTSLAGMAFLAGGHIPGRGEYGEVIENCLNFVLNCVQADGYVTHAGTRMYSHAFATLFLAEICGMTHRQDVRAKLQTAVDFIVRSQNGQGGWRYVPLARESDMSIVVCHFLHECTQLFGFQGTGFVGIKLLVGRNTVGCTRVSRNGAREDTDRNTWTATVKGKRTKIKRQEIRKVMGKKVQRTVERCSKKLGSCVCLPKESPKHRSVFSSSPFNVSPVLALEVSTRFRFRTRTEHSLRQLSPLHSIFC